MSILHPEMYENSFIEDSTAYINKLSPQKLKKWLQEETKSVQQSDDAGTYMSAALYGGVGYLIMQLSDIEQRIGKIRYKLLSEFLLEVYYETATKILYSVWRGLYEEQFPAHDTTIPHADRVRFVTERIKEIDNIRHAKPKTNLDWYLKQLLNVFSFSDNKELVQSQIKEWKHTQPMINQWFQQSDMEQLFAEIPKLVQFHFGIDLQKAVKRLGHQTPENLTQNLVGLIKEKSAFIEQQVFPILDTDEYTEALSQVWLDFDLELATYRSKHENINYVMQAIRYGKRNDLPVFKKLLVPLSNGLSAYQDFLRGELERLQPTTAPTIKPKPISLKILLDILTLHNIINKDQNKAIMMLHNNKSLPEAINWTDSR